MVSQCWFLLGLEGDFVPCLFHLLVASGVLGLWSHHSSLCHCLHMVFSLGVCVFFAVTGIRARLSTDNLISRPLPLLCLQRPLFQIRSAMDWTMCTQNSYFEVYLPVWLCLKMRSLWKSSRLNEDQSRKTWVPMDNDDGDGGDDDGRGGGRGGGGGGAPAATSEELWAPMCINPFTLLTFMLWCGRIGICIYASEETVRFREAQVSSFLLSSCCFPGLTLPAQHPRGPEWRDTPGRCSQIPAVNLSQWGVPAGGAVR